MDDLRVEVRQTPGEIACNFDDIEAALKTQMSAYAELEVTEDNIPERKGDVATLRKIRTAIDDKRKAVKKEWNVPYNAFEDRVKKLEKIIDDQINSINAGLDAFEQKRIAEKRKHVRELYDQQIGDLAEYLPFDVIKSSKWDNKTCSDNEIISAIQEMTLRVKNDLSAINGLQSEIKDKLIAAYKASGNNLTVAIQKHTDYIEAKAAVEKALKAEAEKKAPEPEPVAPTACQPAEPVKVWDEPTLTIMVKGEDNIDALKTFLEMSEIEYEEVRS